MTQDTNNLFPEYFVKFLERVCKSAASLLASEASSVYLLEGDQVVMRAGFGYNKYRVNQTIYKLGAGSTSSVIKPGTVLSNIDSNSREGGWKGKYNKTNPTVQRISNSILTAPLIINNETRGLIQVENKKIGGKYVHYTDDDMEGLKIFINAISDIIQSNSDILTILGLRYVFVLMPFQKKFKNVYELGIKPAVEKAGMRCEKADEIQFNDDILRKIYDCILRADIVISVLTDNNPNVFYETGFSHALSKYTIHLAEKNGKISFDLAHYNHIVYDPEDISDLSTKLWKRLAAAQNDLRKSRSTEKT